MKNYFKINQESKVTPEEIIAKAVQSAMETVGMKITSDAFYADKNTLTEEEFNSACETVNEFIKENNIPLFTAIQVLNQPDTFFDSKEEYFAYVRDMLKDADTLKGEMELAVFGCA